MKIEIEAKIRVEALAPLAEKLETLKAERINNLTETDTYFRDNSGKLHENRCGLRLRRQIGNSGESFLLTFKGPRINSKYKSRPEAQTLVSDPQAMQTILEGLGYEPALLVEKKRQLWKLDACEICLDELIGIGSFIEVEGPNEKEVEAVLIKLGLSDQPHIHDSYAKLTSEYRAQSNES